MRNIKKYTLLEWLALAPLTHCLKQIRNDAWQKNYCRKPADNSKAFLDRTKNIQHIGIVIAFEQPWALSWQLRMAKINVQNLNFLVFDNSQSTAKRAEIQAVCDKNQIPYLALPVNNNKHPNRSHGMAMNWIYHNIIQKIQPETYMFLDHDLIPVLPVSYPPKAMNSQPLYGRLNICQPLHTWHLWAGYCIFNYRKFAAKQLNFLYDFSNGLDTGGRNWHAIYQHILVERIQATPPSSTVADVSPRFH